MMPDEKSSLVEHMVTVHKVSHRQACKAVHLSSSTHRYKKKPGGDEPVINQLHQLVEKHPAIGFWQSYYRIRRLAVVMEAQAGLPGVYVVKIEYPQKAKKRLPARIKQSLFQPDQPNVVWSIDFMAVIL